MSLKKIAEMTGTSPSTVSRVLNDAYPSCASAELKEKIWAAAHEIGYVPDAGARALRKGTAEPKKPKKINVILARGESLETDWFFRDLYRVLEAELFKAGFLTDGIIAAADTQRIAAMECDGAIILGRCSGDLLRALQKKTKNLVGIWRNLLDYEIDEIVCDGRQAAETAMLYLRRLGHRSIGYIGDCSRESRYVGYSEVMIRDHLPIDYHHIVSTNQTREEGAAAMEQLLLQPDITAIFCANDMTALGALDVLRKMRRHSRRRISVISIDDIEDACRTDPMLTTIRIPYADMAHMAVVILQDRMNRGHVQKLRVEFPCQLIERESCMKA